MITAQAVTRLANGADVLDVVLLGALRLRQIAAERGKCEADFPVGAKRSSHMQACDITGE